MHTSQAGPYRLDSDNGRIYMREVVLLIGMVAHLQSQMKAHIIHGFDVAIRCPRPIVVQGLLFIHDGLPSYYCSIFVCTAVEQL